MNEIKCIFCNISSSNVLIEENGFTGKQCPDCGLIYVSPRPSLSEIIDLYGHDNAHVIAENHLSSESEFSSRLNARHHLRILRSFITSGNLLEIGAGGGYFLDEARKIGFTPHAIELNPIQAHHIRNNLNIPCEESALNASLFKGKKFDVIYHCDVISHFFDPISEFKAIFEKINEEGFLIFETGNLPEVDQRHFQYFKRFQYPDHLFFFSAKNINKLLETTGFKLIKIHRYSILPQLALGKMINEVINSVKSIVPRDSKSSKGIHHGHDLPNSSGKSHSSTNIKDMIKAKVRHLLVYLTYILRYKLGSITPKTDRPQTLIVIAQKSAKSMKVT